MPSEYGREESGPINGYGCADCEVWCPRGQDVHPLAWAQEHTRRGQDCDAESIVIVRDESRVAAWEVAG